MIDGRPVARGHVTGWTVRNSSSSRTSRAEPLAGKHARWRHHFRMRDPPPQKAIDPAAEFS